MRKTLLSLAMIVVAASTQNCGGASSSSSPRSYVGTASPGDVWNFTLDSGLGTFSATSDGGHPSDSTKAFSISGTMSTLSNGYIKLVVNTVTGSNGPHLTMDGVNNVGYAVEIPTAALIVQPAGGGPVISSVYNGGCNALNGAGFNYVRTAFGSKSYNVNTADAYGSVTLNGDSAAPGVQAGLSFNVTGGSIGAIGASTGTCSNGVITFPGGVTGLATPAGGGIMVMDQGLGNGGIVIFGGNSLGSADVAGKTFIGLVFKNNGGSTQATKVTFDSSGVGTIVNYSNVETDTVTATQGIIKNITGSGAINGNLFAADGTSNQSAFHAIMQKVTGNTRGSQLVMFGVGQDAGGTSPYNVLLIEQ